MSQSQKRKRNPISIALLSLTVFIAGCQTGGRTASAPASAPAAAPTAQSQTPEMISATRDNCYALLHQLLDREKDIRFLHFIKREDSEVKVLLKKIAVASSEGAKLLKQFAKDDPTIHLEDMRLPQGEEATRAAISVSEQKLILHSKGDALDLILLLTQYEAMNYASFLAQVAAENESDPGRQRALQDISRETAGLREDVIRLLSERKG